MVVKPMITYASVVWRPKMKQASGSNENSTNNIIRDPHESPSYKSCNNEKKRMEKFRMENSMSCKGKPEICERTNIKHILRLYDTEVYLLHKLHGQNHKPFRMGDEQTVRKHARCKFLVHRSCTKNRVWGVYFNIMIIFTDS